MILVTGASGNVGEEVVRALLSAGSPVRAMTRDGASDRFPAGAEAVAGDLNDPASMDTALAGAEAVFLLAGYADSPALLRRMSEAGVSRVVLLSSGAVVGGSLDNAVVRFNVVSEAAVRDSDLTWTVLRPSGFMSNALRWLPALKRADTVSEPFADVPVAVIDPSDIAAVAALALTEGGHEGRSYRLTGPAASLPADRLAVLGRALRRSLRLQPQPDDEARRQMLETMPEPMVAAMFAFFREGAYDDARVDPTAPALLGRPLRTFADWAEAHASRFA